MEIFIVFKSNASFISQKNVHNHAGIDASET